MAKELTCEVLKEYGEIKLDDENSIKMVEIKWNGRQPKGYDIRRYNSEEERWGKGVTIPYDSVDELTNIIVDNELCDIDNLEDKIKKEKSKRFNMDDFSNMFNKMNQEMSKYKRDKYGLLRDKNNRIVIASRRKKLEVE